MAKVKGICRNIDEDCSKAISKEVQEAEKDDFVCSECGAPLKEVTATAAGGNKGGGNKLIPIIIGAVVAIAAVVGGGYAMGWFDSHAREEEQVTVGGGEGGLEMPLPGDTDTTEVAGTTVEPIDTPSTHVVTPVEPKEETKAGDTTAASGKNLGYGYYSGSYPTGVGTINIRRDHTFETTSGDVYAEAGDVVVGAKFKDGRLIQGELHSQDGSRTWMTFGAM